jgi:hypothetical protein
MHVPALIQRWKQRKSNEQEKSIMPQIEATQRKVRSREIRVEYIKK